jgi:osmotically-inducible protein OsmY
MERQEAVHERTVDTDAQIQREVLEEIALQPHVDPGHVGVSVHDGIVTLTGHVKSYLEKYEAEKAAKRVRGVKVLVNEIDIHLPGDEKSTDEDIAVEIRRTLRSHLLLTALDIKVTVSDGWVTLEGEVPWQYQKLAAEAAIRHVPGIKGITNLIAVRPRVEPTEVKAQIERALKRHADLDASRIKVNVEGGKVTLQGTVRSLSQKEEVERVAWSVPGVFKVENLLSVEP